MKVLLNSDIEKLGKVGDQVEVKPGYARNYLFPNNFAVQVTKHNVEILAMKRKKLDEKLELEKLTAEEQKGKIEGIKIEISKKSGENDVLFGSVTTQEIEKKLAELGVNIERKKIHLEEPIKKLGNFTCKIKLFEDVEAEVKIEVTKEGEEAHTSGDKAPVGGKTPTARDKAPVGGKTPTTGDKAPVGEKTPTARDKAPVGKKTPTAGDEALSGHNAPSGENKSESK